MWFKGFLILSFLASLEANEMRTIQNPIVANEKLLNSLKHEVETYHQLLNDSHHQGTGFNSELRRKFHKAYSKANKIIVSLNKDFCNYNLQAQNNHDLQVIREKLDNEVSLKIASLQSLIKELRTYLESNKNLSQSLVPYIGDQGSIKHTQLPKRKKRRKATPDPYSLSSINNQNDPNGPTIHYHYVPSNEKNETREEVFVK